MPTNQTKIYNQLLDLLYNTERENIASIKKVYQRDFVDAGDNKYKEYPVVPTPAEGEDVMERQFRHLTTIITDEKTKKRTFESDRAIRLHWIKNHLQGKCQLISFKVDDERRVYLLDKPEKYVIILEPQRNNQILYLLTAYRLQSSSYKKIMNKYEKRGTPI
jgi:hypothetical protein